MRSCDLVRRSADASDDAAAAAAGQPPAAMPKAKVAISLTIKSINFSRPRQAKGSRKCGEAFLGPDGLETRSWMPLCKPAANPLQLRLVSWPWLSILFSASGSL